MSIESDLDALHAELTTAVVLLAGVSVCVGCWEGSGLLLVKGECSRRGRLESDPWVMRRRYRWQRPGRQPSRSASQVSDGLKHPQLMSLAGWLGCVCCRPSM